MRAAGIPESPARVEFTVRFSHGPKGRRRAGEASDLLAPGKSTALVPKITRLLVLGHHFERLVSEGKVKDYAQIARLTGLTRARVTQIVNLTLLAPEIQEEILLTCDARLRPSFSVERQLRVIMSATTWGEQRILLRRGRNRHSDSLR